MTDDQEDRIILAIVCFALGAAFGVLLVMM